MIKYAATAATIITGIARRANKPSNAELSLEDDDEAVVVVTGACDTTGDVNETAMTGDAIGWLIDGEGLESTARFATTLVTFSLQWLVPSLSSTIEHVVPAAQFVPVFNF